MLTRKLYEFIGLIVPMSLKRDEKN